MCVRRRNWENGRLRSVAAVLFLTIILLYSLFFSFQNILLCKHIEDSDFMEYVGEFTVSKKTRVRNTIYFITLANGDVIRVNPDLVKNNEVFLSNASLQFIYSSPQYCFSSVYHCVEIRNPSDETLYLSSTTAYSEAKSLASIGLALTLLSSLLVIPVCFEIMLGKQRRSRKKRT